MTFTPTKELTAIMAENNISSSEIATWGTEFEAYVETSRVRKEYILLADDAVGTVSLPDNSEDILLFAINTQRTVASSGAAGLFRARANPSFPFVENINVNTTVATFTTGVLTGTTGTDGKITISVAGTTLYVENRLGSSERVDIVILGT